MYNDEGFNLFGIATDQEKIAMLVESSQPVNVGTIEAPQVTFYTYSLDDEEQKHLKTFLRERKICFAWSYVDMLGLDTSLVIFDLIVHPQAKLVK